jgi:Na+-transporting methylmalonyl-CoA/oxaloacetate decarboxylase beta subunit
LKSPQLLVSENDSLSILVALLNRFTELVLVGSSVRGNLQEGFLLESLSFLLLTLSVLDDLFECCLFLLLQFEFVISNLLLLLFGALAWGGPSGHLDHALRLKVLQELHDVRIHVLVGARQLQWGLLLRNNRFLFLLLDRGALALGLGVFLLWWGRFLALLLGCFLHVLLLDTLALLV